MQGWQPPGSGGPGQPGGYGPPTQNPATETPATAATQMAPAGMVPAPAHYPPSTQQSHQYPQPAYGPPNPYAQPTMAQAPMPGHPPGYGFGQYEFNDMENAIIAKTAGRARIWGFAAIATGALWLISSVFFFLKADLLFNVVPGIGNIIVGVVFLGVGNSLNSIVRTQGNDIEHMMQALEKLGTSFLIQIIVLIVQVVLYAIIAAIVFLVLAVFIAAGGP